MSHASTLETKVSEQERVIARLQREVDTLKRAAGAASHNAERYRTLFDSLDAGFCIIEVMFDEQGKAFDYRFADVNVAFERQTGLSDVIGKTMRSLAPGHEQHWFDFYGDVAVTGEARHFENTAAMLGRYYEVYAFRTGSPEEHRVGVLFNDVSARKEAEAAQRDAIETKDQFLATLAHELRNPLAPLQSGIEVLRLVSGDPAGNRAESERVLEMMNRQIGHLKHLMDGLLDVSRINRGMVTLHNEHLDLRTVVRQAVASSSSAIYAGDRQVSIDLPSEALPIEGDPDRLVQVVTGLLDNAAKFTEDGGRIRLTAERRGGMVRLSVQDDGLGIDPDMLGEIFAMFSQANTDRHGLGIGLTLVRNLVELHGGTVQAHSRGRGQGSEFVVQLPLRDGADAEARSQRRSDLPPLGRQRLLVVDDNRDAADSLAALLRAMGADVQTAYDGRSALQLLDELQPEIVFLDIGMPEMDGYEVARRMRQRHGARNIMLVAVTGWGQPADRQRASEAGFDSHLVKPATFDELQKILTPRRRG